MHICRKIGNANIIFAEDKNCHVYTIGETKWLQFLKQRIRWSSDVSIMLKTNFGFYLILCGFLFIHIKLLFLFLMFIFLNKYFYLLTLYLIIKFIFELCLYNAGSKRLNNSMNFFHFMVWYFIHIPYVVLIGFCSFFNKSFYWKDRKHYL